MAQGASQAAVARRQFELGMGHGLWHNNETVRKIVEAEHKIS